MTVRAAASADSTFLPLLLSFQRICLSPSVRWWTNSLATSNMLKGGANDGATGENAIVLNAGRSDIIVGVVAIVVANAILGELTPTMAQAIGASNARRILIPFDSCNTRIAMLSNGPLQAFIDQAVRMTTDYVGELL